ncbi:SIR2 family protein [Christiangramia sp. OXR-203]|uniref:SIR2 family protein n=1 Tax=Christiangramia sp. OXR-203 TaxID=3100176 RepID=UPI002AC9127B|nr:SIR2 family protein [Christiangramia sp. OXR-203]WPY99841.1 SIR2 family protein [Christiangramia sp. OXR-203]
MPSKEITQLKHLKDKLRNQKMSVLVGAGFSKNVSNIFPSWWELLYDMTYFLFESDIEESWKDFKVKTKKPGERKKFIDQKISYYISKTGYLNIVSEYLKRKGIREAITSYIEEKTPNIIREGKHSFLVNSLGGKNNKIVLKSTMLSQHRLLLQLPWNNIYTTNYDKLLEEANDSLTANSIDNEISEIQHEIDVLEKEEATHRSNLSRLKAERDSLSNKITRLEKDPKLMMPIEENLEELKGDLDHKDSEIRKSEIRLTGVLKNIKDKEAELLQLKKAQELCISTVTKASELSIKRNKNIIKLHGTLRKNETYGFDNDIQKQYVIAQEDYDTYPVKHEAFTQLMRISLLQESYCLIGFSGDDTNFLEWIKWVREILRSKESTDDDYQIYLIDVQASPIPKEKSLFYENHSIFPIRLMDDKVIDFLESKTGRSVTSRTKIKDVIELFFQYLRGKHQVNVAKATFEHLQYSKYKRAWEMLPLFTKGDPINFQTYQNSLKRMVSVEPFSLFPSLHFVYSHDKQRFLFHALPLLEKASTKKDKETVLNLILIALQDCYLGATDFVWEQKSEEKITEFFERSSSAIRNKFLKLKLREAVLKCEPCPFEKILHRLPKRKDDKIKYETLLLKAFQFDFKHLKKALKAWNPKGNYLLKKTGLLTLFDTRWAFEYVKEELEHSELTNQEELFVLEMYRYLHRSLYHTSEKELMEAIQGYKNAGLRSIFDNIDHLTESINKNKINLKRYGEGRFNVSQSMTFSNDFTPAQKGAQFIQLLLENGLPVSVDHMNLKNHGQCYPLFRAVYKYLPYPVIFFALQFSEQKILRRLGQDYAYTEGSDLDLDQILQRLLSSYQMEATPHRFKEGILFFTSELFIATDPETWELDFEKIWKLDDFQKRVYRDRWEAERIFMTAGLPYIKNSDIITRIIISIIKTPTSNISVEFLYNLANNPLLENRGFHLQTAELTRELDSLIGVMDQDENHIFMLGNLSSILNEAQKNQIFQMIKSVEFEAIRNERVWSILIFFSKGNQSVLGKIKNAILHNNKLFNAGFKDKKSLSSGINFIEISRLSNFYRSVHIQWSKKEAREIFKKIKSELTKIEDWLSKRDHDFKFILKEMLLFLEKEEKHLSTEPDYQEVLKKIHALHTEHRGYNSLVEGILATDPSEVIWALNELSTELYEKKSIRSVSFEVGTTLNKLLTQAPPSLEEALKYLVNWITHKDLATEFKAYHHLISSVLDRYTKDELEDCNKPYVYKQLIDIAQVLEEWGVDTESVVHWKDYALQTSFNNIRFATNP